MERMLLRYQGNICALSRSLDHTHSHFPVAQCVCLVATVTISIKKTRARSISLKRIANMWPAPRMFYVPGLRPVFQKQAGRAEWQTTARRSRQLERTRAFSYASYPGIVSQRGSKEGISSGYNAFTTSRNSREHRISGQLGASACYKVYCYCYQ